jgi:Fusaric acid resistance protein family
LVAWRSVADHQEFHPDAAAQAPRVRECLPTILTTSEGAIDTARWRSNPLGMRAAMRTAARRLVALPAETASPAGALSAQSWEQCPFVGLTALFIPLLGPSNPETDDPSHFSNMALPLVSGIALAMLAMRLMPPATRARRLLALTLRV